MGNLKKVLSMILAVMMVMALMTTAFAAEAKALDYSDSQFQDEAMLLYETGIIVGGDSGAWDAERLVTRGEFCKMICVAMNGGVDNPALYTGDNTTGLTDIDGHWAKGYIIYCFKLGIISGWDGIFSPNTSVTGVQAAKILLTALGYDAVKEGYVDVADWELNINVKAGEVGLYEGFSVSFDPRQPLSRDYAAKMISNMFDARMVYYDQNINVQQEVQTFGQKRMRLTKVEGILMSNEYATVGYAPDSAKSSVGLAPAGKSYISVSNPYGTTGARINNVVIPITSNIEDLGKAVNVYVKFKAGSATYGDTGTALSYPESSIEKVYGEIAPTTKNNILRTGKGFSALNGTGSLTAFVVDDNRYRLDATNTQVVYNYDSDYINIGYYNTTADFFSGDVMLKGDRVTIIDNNDDRIVDYIIAVADTYATVTRYNTSTSKITFEVAGASRAAIDFDDVLGVDDVAVDDKVLYYHLVDADMYVVEAVESFTGTLTGGTTAGSNRVAIINGKNYQFANTNHAASGLTSYPFATNGKEATWERLDTPENFDADVTYWLDSFGYILDYKGAEGEDAYCVVTDVSLVPYVSLGQAQAAQGRVSVLTEDNTRKTYNIRNVDVYDSTVSRVRTAKWDNSKLEGTDTSNDIYAILDLLDTTNASNASGSNLAAIGMVFSYTISDDGNYIDLKKGVSVAAGSENNSTGTYSIAYATALGNIAGTTSWSAYNKTTNINVYDGTSGQYNWLVNENSVFFIYNDSNNGDGDWHTFKGYANVPQITSTNPTAATQYPISVINPSKTNEPNRIGAISFSVDQASMVTGTGRYVIVVSTPILSSVGSARYTTFKGLYKGEVSDYKTTTDMASADLIAKGAVLTYDGNPTNIQEVYNEGFRNAASPSTLPQVPAYAGYLTSFKNAVATISTSMSSASNIKYASSSKYTEVSGDETSNNFTSSLIDTPITVVDPNYNNVGSIAVLDGDGVIIDLVSFGNGLPSRNELIGRISNNAFAATGAPGTLNVGDTSATFTFTLNAGLVFGTSYVPQTSDFTARLSNGTPLTVSGVAAAQGGSTAVATVSLSGVTIPTGATVIVTYNGRSAVVDQYGRAIASNTLTSVAASGSLPSGTATLGSGLFTVQTVMGTFASQSSGNHIILDGGSAYKNVAGTIEELANVGSLIALLGELQATDTILAVSDSVRTVTLVAGTDRTLAGTYDLGTATITKAADDLTIDAAAVITANVTLSGTGNLIVNGRINGTVTQTSSGTTTFAATTNITKFVIANTGTGAVNAAAATIGEIEVIDTGARTLTLGANARTVNVTGTSLTGALTIVPVANSAITLGNATYGANVVINPAANTDTPFTVTAGATTTYTLGATFTGAVTLAAVTTSAQDVGDDFTVLGDANAAASITTGTVTHTVAGTLTYDEK